MVMRFLLTLLLSLACAQAGSGALENRGTRSTSFWSAFEFAFSEFEKTLPVADNEDGAAQQKNIRTTFKGAWLAYLDHRFDEPYALELNGPGTVTYESMGFTTTCAKRKEMNEVSFWRTKQLDSIIVRIWLVDADEALWPGIKDCICSMDPFGDIMSYVRDKTQIIQRPEISPDASLEDAKGVSVYTDFERDLESWGVSFNQEETLFLKKLDGIIQNELLKILSHFKNVELNEFVLAFLPDAYRRWDDYRRALVPFYKSIGFNDRVIKLRLLTLTLARLYFYINFGQHFMTKGNQERCLFLPPMEYGGCFDCDGVVRSEKGLKPFPPCFPED